jgi:hypothetical protein
VGKGPHHDESSDVLVVGVQRRHGGVVLRHEGIRRQGVHVLRHQGGDHPQGSQGQTQLEVQGIVQRVIQTLVTITQAARGACGHSDFLDAVADAEVGAVHVPAMMKITAIAKW